MEEKHSEPANLQYAELQSPLPQRSFLSRLFGKSTPVPKPQAVVPNGRPQLSPHMTQQQALALLNGAQNKSSGITLQIYGIASTGEPVETVLSVKKAKLAEIMGLPKTMDTMDMVDTIGGYIQYTRPAHQRGARVVRGNGTQAIDLDTGMVQKIAGVYPEVPAPATALRHALKT
jgi:hypothetical protein